MSAYCAIRIVVALAEPGVQVVPEYDVVEGDQFVGCPYWIVA